MASRKNTTTTPVPPSLRRPLLAGGEQLREGAERSRGGNPFEHPYSVDELQALLRPQAQKLATDIAAMPEDLTGRHVVIEASMFPNYIAASHFPDSLLDHTFLYTVGTRQSRGTRRSKTTEKQDVPTKTLLLAGSRENVAEFAELAASELQQLDPKILNDIRGFSGICVPAPDAVVTLPQSWGEGEVITWEAVLTTIGRNEYEWKLWGDEAFEKWVNFIRSLSGDVDVRYKRTLDRVTFVPISLEVGRVHDAARFNLLRSIRPMPKMRQFPECSKRSIMTLLPGPSALDQSTRPRSDRRVAVFDGGLDASSPYFAPFVKLFELTPEPECERDLRHGSMVTSALLYGSLASVANLDRPECHVDHYRVLPLPSQHKFDDELCWFLDQIVDVVRSKKYENVLLSVGPDEVLDDNGEPHRWTSTLDALAHELGVVFVVAAGNNGGEDEENGFNRVQVPADMANGIGVGAYGTRKNARLQRASYSPVGPGRPGQRVQPVGLGFGGCEDEPFVGIVGRDKPDEGFGTSYAAPTAMRGLVGLSTGLGSRAAPETVRAFAAHYTQGGTIKSTRITEIGYGRMRESYNNVWECPPNEVTVLYQDSLKRGQTTAMRFPVPTSGIEPEAEIEIIWTLCYMSVVHPGDTADYTLSGFETRFRPHQRRRNLYNENKELVKEVDALLEEEFVRTYLATHSGTLSPNPVAHPGWGRGRHESEQRDAGKWETLSRGQVRMQASELYMPRLDLTYVARANGVLIGGIPDLRTTLLVSIRAPKEIALYDLVREQFKVLLPLEQHTQVDGL